MSVLGLNDLATETLEDIFKYLNVFDVCGRIRKLSRRYHDLTFSTGFWHKYLDTHYNYSPITRGYLEPEPWNRSVSIGKEQKRWEELKGLRRYKSAEFHIATIDALKVHETNNGFRMAITGSRDRTIRLWDLNKVIVEENPTNWSPCSLAAHDGWIWSIALADDDKTLYSCGFDSQLKQHEITESSLKTISVASYPHALLKCYSEGPLVYCTTIRGGVHLIDSRVDLTPQRTISELNNINGTYMAIRPDQDQFFVTHSENVPLYQIDKREFRVMKRTRLYRNTSCTSLHLAKNHLLINVKSGDVYYYNLQKQMMEYKWQPNKGKEVPGLVHVVNAHESDGVVFYMTAYELSAYMPGRKGTLYDNLESKNVFINMDYNNGDLVATTGNGGVCFWPREYLNLPASQ